MYTIQTPNPFYNGKTHGVSFEKGIGTTEDENVKNILVNDFGYKLLEETKTKKKANKE